MTPVRQQEELEAELVALEDLLKVTPHDPQATPLLTSRVQAIKSQIQKIADAPSINPEAEIFFEEGPVIGAEAIEAKFAGDVMKRFQDMVTNHYAASFFGSLRQLGRRRGESQSKLFLTALPRGSFGLQLAQPHVGDFVDAANLTKTMEEITTLVDATKDDQTFFEAITRFNPRVLVPLTAFLETLHNAGSDCKIFSGRNRTTLHKAEVDEAYRRAISAKTETVVEVYSGSFGGVLVESGRFEFTPTGESMISGYLAEEVTADDAADMDKLVLQKCKASIRRTTVTVRTGRKTNAFELVALSLESAPF